MCFPFDAEYPMCCSKHVLNPRRDPCYAAWRAGGGSRQALHPPTHLPPHPHTSHVWLALRRDGRFTLGMRLPFHHVPKYTYVSPLLRYSKVWAAPRGPKRLAQGDGCGNTDSY